MDLDCISWTSGVLNVPLCYRPPVSPVTFTNTDHHLMICRSYFSSPEILRMAELNDSSELQKYSQAVLYILSAVPPPPEYVELIADNFLTAISSSTVNYNYLNIISRTSTEENPSPGVFD